MKITLSVAEARFAASVGVERHVQSICDGRPDKHGHKGAGWNLHIEGACGEYAAAKALGVHWDGSVNSFKDGDDILGWQVRTRSKDDYELIIRKDDNQDDTFILVTGLCPNYNIIGWIKGKDGMQDEFLQTHGGREKAWFVPHSKLHKFRQDTGDGITFL